MHIFQPTETIRRTWRRAGIFVKSVADVISGAVGLAAEDDVGSGVHDGIQFLILSYQFDVKLQQQFRLECQLLGALQNPLLQFAIQTSRAAASCDAVRQIR